jgi:hypothetical protein
VTERHRLHAGERRLGCGLRSAKQALETSAPRALRRRQHSADGTHAAVERELAEDRVAVEALLRDLVGGGEDRQRNGEVEAGSLLAQRRRSEVHGDAMGRPLEPGRHDARAHTVFRLLARAVGKTDDREAGQAALDARLDLDPAGVEADQRVRDRPCEHIAATVAAHLQRVCSISVPNHALGIRR